MKSESCWKCFTAEPLNYVHSSITIQLCRLHIFFPLLSSLYFYLYLILAIKENCHTLPWLGMERLFLCPHTSLQPCDIFRSLQALVVLITVEWQASPIIGAISNAGLPPQLWFSGLMNKYKEPWFKGASESRLWESALPCEQSHAFILDEQVHAVAV